MLTAVKKLTLQLKKHSNIWIS